MKYANTVGLGDMWCSLDDVFKFYLEYAENYEGGVAFYFFIFLCGPVKLNVYL